MTDASEVHEHTQLRRQIDQLSERNTKLAALLKDARVKLQQLLAEVWGVDHDPHSNVVDVCVRQLRTKVGSDHIETVRGVGYKAGGQG